MGASLNKRCAQSPLKALLNYKIKGSVREEWKGILAYGEKYSLLIVTNLTSNFYKEKIVKTTCSE